MAPTSWHLTFRRNGANRVPLILLAFGLLVTACGSHLDEEELRAANDPFLRGVSTADGQGIPGVGGVSSLGPDVGTGAGLSPGSVGQTIGRGSSLPGAATKSEILLGSYGAQSGIAGAALASIPVAIRSWVADVNARGGLNGHPVRVIMRDVGTDPAIEITTARRMVEQDKVLAMFALFGSGSSASYLEEKGVPVIGGTARDDADTSPVVFVPQTGALKGTARSYLTPIVTLSTARKVAIFHTREAPQTGRIAKGMKQYAPLVGVEIVYEAQVSFAQPDFTAEVIGARGAGAEAVSMIIDYPSVLRIIRSAHRQGWRPVFASGAPIFEDAFIAEGGDEAAGVLGVATVAPYTASPAMRAYLAAVRRFVPGGKVAGYGAEIWAGGKLFEAIASALGDTPTRAQIFEGLYRLRRETLGGIVPPLTFPRGPHGSVNLCSVPIRVSNGRFMAPRGPNLFFCAPDGRGLQEVRV